MSAKAPAQTVAAPARPSFTSVPARHLQKKCSCGGSGGECGECKKKKSLQRSAAGPGVSAVPPIVNSVLASPGRPLDPATRSFLEPRFGHDFSRVRIHDDARAAESTRAVNAHAYTVGEDIVFDSGRYDPGSRDGLHLLSHELAHTVQQSGLQRRAADLPLGGSMESQLEREADRAADAVLAGGLPGSPTRLAAPHLSRKEATPVPPAGTATSLEEPVRDWEDAPAALQKLGVSHQSKLRTDVAPTIRAYRLPMLPLPPEKGPVAEIWKKVAAAGALQSIVGFDGRPRSVLKQARPGTDALQKIWLDKVKWSRTEAPKLWQAAGGDKASSFEPKVGGQTCHMDHILELQIGGNNTTENMQVLDGAENVESGTAIFRYLKAKAAEIRNQVPALKEIILQFDQVSQTSSICGPCCKVEQKAAASAGKGVSGPVGAGAAFEDYPIKAGSETRLEIPAGHLKPRKTVGVPLAESSSGQNKAASTLIPGMVMEHLRLKAAGADSVDSVLDTGNDKTRLPLTVAKNKSKVALEVDAKTGELKLSNKSKKPNIAFTYPYLSKGTITDLSYAPEGISGKGKLTPSIPFLSEMQLGVAFGPGRLEITGGIDPKKISPPIPGARITRAELTMALFPEFQPSGNLDFELAPGGKKMLDAALTIKRDDDGLVATGKLRAYIPGVDQAEGDVKYRYKEGWSGVIAVESTQIKLPYVKSGTVTVAFMEGKEISAEGTVGLEVPGGHTAEVKLTKKGPKWIYSGKGNFKIPKLKEARVALTYDGEKLYGEGETSFVLLGLDGKIKVFYSANATGGDARIWGDGEVVFERNRAKGWLKVGLSPKQKFFGEGQLSYQVTKDLVAMAGAVLDDNEKLRIQGGLKFPRPIPLFKPIAGDKELFKAGITIPIPGASIGPVGLVVKIDGALGARYSIGPGELRNACIESAVNPLEDNPDLDLQLGATLYVGASAGIYGSIRGAIAVDAKIASLSGGLTVTASADVAGQLEALMVTRYQKGRFNLTANSELSAGLRLGLKLDADVTAEAGVGWLSVRTSKVWNLASYQYDTGLKFGMKARLAYASDQPFKPPSMDEIEWIKPELRVPNMLEVIMKRATAKQDPAG